MTYDEYVKEVCTYHNKNTDMITALLGLAEETGEVIGLFKKARRAGKEVNYVKLKEEMGDVYYYISLLLAFNGLKPEEIWEENVEKIKERSEKFDV